MDGMMMDDRPKTLRCLALVYGRAASSTSLNSSTCGITVASTWPENTKRRSRVTEISTILLWRHGVLVFTRSCYIQSSNDTVVDSREQLFVLDSRSSELMYPCCVLHAARFMKCTSTVSQAF